MMLVGFAGLLLGGGKSFLLPVLLPVGLLGFVAPLWEPPGGLIVGTASVWILAQLMLHAGFLATGEWKYLNRIVALALLSLAGAIVTMLRPHAQIFIG